MVWKPEKNNLEKEETKGLDIHLIRKKGNSKTYSGYLIQKLKEARKDNNLELAQVIEHFYKKYNEYQTSEKILLKRFKGEGNIQYFNQPDKIVVTYYQKFDEGEEPRVVADEVSKQEINKAISIINKLNEGKRIPTSKIAEEFYGKSWKAVFSTRFEHIRLTHILSILSHYGITNYSKRGFTSVIKPVREIQEVLSLHNNKEVKVN